MTDCAWGENPPAASVVIAWHTASNQGMPARPSAITSAAVSPA